MRSDTGDQSLVSRAKAEWETGQPHTSQQAEDAKPKQGQCKKQDPRAHSGLKLTRVDEEERKLRNTSPFGQAEFFVVASCEGMCLPLPPDIILPLIYKG